MTKIIKTIRDKAGVYLFIGGGVLVFFTIFGLIPLLLGLLWYRIFSKQEPEELDEEDEDQEN